MTPSETPAESPAGLRVENLSWGPKRAARWGMMRAIKAPPILHPVSFTVAPGQVLAIVGANGAGKSTLLRLLYRYLRPSTGQVFLKDQDIWSMPARAVARSIAVVLQEQPTDFALTVAEIVALGRTPHLMGFSLATSGGQDDARIIKDALEKLGLAPLAGRMFSTLSGGERQRVMIARALAQQPGLLILDEPTNHIDIRHQLEVLSLIRTLGPTIVTSLHDINLAASHADRVLVLSQGRALACGPPAEALTESLITQSFGVQAIRQQLQPSGDPHLTFHL